jgi:hypothetical protein
MELDDAALAVESSSPLSIARFKNAKGGVVGGGVLVADDLILTCAHVVNAALGRAPTSPERPTEELTIDFPLVGGGEHTGRIATWSPLVAVGSGDVAVLRLDAGAGLPPVPLIARAPDADERLAVFGFIQGHPDGVWKRDITVAGPATGGWAQVGGTRGRDYRLAQGFSGCPVFDVTFRAVGILAQADADPSVDTGLYIPSPVLVGVTAEGDMPSPLVIAAHDGALVEYLLAVRRYAEKLPYLTVQLQLPQARDLPDLYVPLRVRGETEETPRDPGSVLSADDAPLLVVGPGGSGKSMLVQFLAFCAQEDPERAGLPEPMLPLIVPLPSLAAADPGLAPTARLAAAVQSLGLAFQSPLPDDFFARWSSTEGRRWLVLLDGFDEVPDSAQLVFENWLVGLVSSLAGAGHRVVMTSRPRDFSPALLGVAHRVELMVPDDEQRVELARSLLGGRADGFIAALDGLGLEGVTPLIVTLAATVYLSGGKLPERRAELYERVIGILLDQGDARGLRDRLGEQLAPSLRPLLRRVAEVMVGPAAAGEAVLTSLGQVLRSEFDEPPLAARSLAARLLDAIADLTALLTRRGADLAWSHPSFGEYLRAERIVELHPEGGESGLDAAFAGPDSGVATFAVGLWDGRGSDQCPSLLQWAATHRDRVHRVAHVLKEIGASGSVLEEFAASLLAQLGQGITTWEYLTAMQALAELSTVRDDADRWLREYILSASSLYHSLQLAEYSLNAAWLLGPDVVEQLVLSYVDTADVPKMLLREAASLDPGLDRDELDRALAGPDVAPRVAAALRQARDSVLARVERMQESCPTPRVNAAVERLRRELEGGGPASAIRQYAIYDHPADHRDGFVVREWLIDTQGAVRAGQAWTAPTLEHARELIPAGATLLPRDATDDATIAEVWM